MSAAREAKARRARTMAGGRPVDVCILGSYKEAEA